jgi:FAD/FMN-containing dehydrogenase
LRWPLREREQVMRVLKRTLDPNNVLNLGKRSERQSSGD